MEYRACMQARPDAAYSRSVVCGCYISTFNIELVYKLCDPDRAPDWSLENCEHNIWMHLSSPFAKVLRRRWWHVTSLETWVGIQGFNPSGMGSHLVTPSPRMYSIGRLGSRAICIYFRKWQGPHSKFGQNNSYFNG